MTSYTITHSVSGRDFGTYEGETPNRALAAMLRDAGIRATVDAHDAIYLDPRDVDADGVHLAGDLGDYAIRSGIEVLAQAMVDGDTDDAMVRDAIVNGDTECQWEVRDARALAQDIGLGSLDVDAQWDAIRAAYEAAAEEYRESEVDDDDEPAQHVVIAGEAFGVDTAQQIREARAAMIRNGVAEAVIYAGSAPDAVRTRLLLFACPASIVVSPNNGATTEAITGDASAAIFLDRYGVQNAVSTLRDHDLPTEEYDGAFALLAALDACCAEGEVPTLP